MGLHELLMERLFLSINPGTASSLFNHVWKIRPTPEGFPVLALRASPLKAAATLGWPTPNARDFKCGPSETYAERSGTTKGDSLSNLVTAVCAGWPTPMAGTPAQNGNNAAGNNDSSRQTVALAGWPTTTVMDAVGAARHGYMNDGMERSATNPRKEVLTGHAGTTLTDAARMCGPARLTATGLLLTGSTAETAAGGQLRPGHSRWLMGLPSVWDFCGVTGMASLRQRPKRSSRRTSGR